LTLEKEKKVISPLFPVGEVPARCWGWEKRGKKKFPAGGDAAGEGKRGKVPD